jgi:hypothetical protein
VTIHTSCPSEYAATALELGALDTTIFSEGTISGPKFSHRCFACGDDEVFSGNPSRPCSSCPTNQTSAPDWMMCGTCPIGAGRTAALTECEIVRLRAQKRTANFFSCASAKKN